MNGVTQQNTKSHGRKHEQKLDALGGWESLHHLL